ncbi:MAG: hypothetical protein WCA39_08435 [Nitrososphaeraceae archaeon]
MNDIKKDMEELVSIINEEHIARLKLIKISEYCGIYDTNKNIQLDRIRDFLKHESDIAYITGLKDHKISDKFIDKIIDIVSRYGTEELAMLFNCTFLVLNDMESKNPLNTKTVK